MFDFQTRLESVALAAWEKWTGNGRTVSRDEWGETFESTRDAANNAFVEGIDESTWIGRTLARLGVCEAGA